MKELILNCFSVGGGTSGSVLASRLSENEEATVLLIEAGDTPEKNPFVDTPIFADRLKDGPYDWSYKTVPQKHSCKGHVDKAGVYQSSCRLRPFRIIEIFDEVCFGFLTGFCF